MGVYQRPESKYYWLYLETTKQKERTDVLIGETAAQKKDAKRLAEETYQRRMLELAEQKIRPLAKASIRFSAYAEAYARDVIALRRGARRELEMLKPLRAFFDSDLISKMDADRVRAYMAARKVQPRTVNREIDLLKGMLRDAVPKYLPVSPIAGLKRIKAAPVKRRLLEPAEEKRLLAACEDAQDKALIMLGLDTLIRLGDLLDLERTDRDGSWLYVKHAKSGEAYETALSPRCAAVLDTIETTDARYYFAKFRGALDPRDWLGSVRKRFKFLCKEADVLYGRATGLTFHWATRRTGATRYLLDKRAPISAVQKQGNWKHPEMLLQIYAEARRDDQLAMVGAGPRLRKRA
ncbi:MAG TPA: tyrosine-type recombinase/integrase [Vicinamibacterales bacterium]|nr:tyrosine-type recombinase/integrase [Vicinamibacterales bacterium]